MALFKLCELCAIFTLRIRRLAEKEGFASFAVKKEGPKLPDNILKTGLFY